MKFMLRTIDAVNRHVGEWGSLIYLAVFAVTIFDVFSRYFFNSPTVWGLELVIALAGIHYVLAGGHAQLTDSHVRIDVIFKLLPDRLKRIMRVVSSLLTIALMGVITYYGILQAYPAVIAGETTGAGWNSHAPVWMKVAIPVGAGLMLLQAVAELLRELGGATNGR